MHVCNLFAYRATDPKVMKAATEPVGAYNDCHILKLAQQAGMVVCVWGDHGIHMGRSKQVLQALRNIEVPLHYLVMNKTGEPSHPLYLRKDLKPIKWED